MGTSQSKVKRPHSEKYLNQTQNPYTHFNLLSDEIVLEMYVP